MMRRKITKESYGEWAVITGASSGVGREMALEIASKGISVVLVARREALLTKLASEIEEKFKVETKNILADFSQKEAIKKVIEACESLEVGLLINSAGYALTGEFSDNTLEDEVALLDVNVKTPLVLSHHFSKQMKERKKGGIIFLSSIMALGAAKNWASYNASKSHNLLLAEGMGEELKSYGVNVIALTPGSIKSGFGERSDTKAMFGALKSRRVARCGLWMLGCKRTHTAGLLNKIIVLATRITPRFLNTKIFSFVVGGIIK
jgi:short-subunit dehydrogenase